MNTQENNQQLNIDNSKLETFDTTRINASDLGSFNKRGVIMGQVQQTSSSLSTEAPVEEATEEEVNQADEQEPEQTEEEVTDETSPEFVQQFEQAFGIKPKEAVELVNSLQAFRDEQVLMRNWGVDPVAYDERMTQVREFYSSLPEEGREQFNTVEGAVAIWNHLQESGKAKETKVKQKTTANSRVKRAQQKPSYDFTRSQITNMPKEEYQRMLPAIVKAFQTGRVLDK